MAMFSYIEPKSKNEANIDESQIEAMKKKKIQFEINKVYNLVPLTQDKISLAQDCFS